MNNKRNTPMLVGAVFLVAGIFVALSDQGFWNIALGSVLVYFGWANLKITTHAKNESIDEILDTSRSISNKTKKEIDEILR